MSAVPALVTLQQQSQGGPDWSFFMMLGVIVVIFYFLVYRPESGRRKTHEALLASAAKDDQVVTRGGLRGRVVTVADDVLTLEIGRVKGGSPIRVEVERSHLEKVTKPAAGSDGGDDS